MCWGFSNEQNRQITLPSVELAFWQGSRDDIQNKKINDILGWRMMNATEEKRAEKGLGNARLIGGGATLLKRMVREGLMEKMTPKQMCLPCLRKSKECSMVSAERKRGDKV